MYYKTKVEYLGQDDEGLIKKVTTELVVEAETWTEAEAATIAWAEQVCQSSGDIDVTNVSRTPYENFVGYEGSSEFWKGVLSFKTETPNGKTKTVKERMILNADGVDSALELFREATKDSLVQYSIIELTLTAATELISWDMFAQDGEEVYE